MTAGVRTLTAFLMVSVSAMPALAETIFLGPPEITPTGAPLVPKRIELDHFTRTETGAEGRIFSNLLNSYWGGTFKVTCATFTLTMHAWTETPIEVKVTGDGEFARLPDSEWRDLGTPRGLLGLSDDAERLLTPLSPLEEAHATIVEDTRYMGFIAGYVLAKACDEGSQQ